MFSVSKRNPHQLASGQSLSTYALVLAFVAIIGIGIGLLFQEEIAAIFCRILNPLNPNAHCPINGKTPPTNTALVMPPGVNGYLLNSITPPTIEVEAGYPGRIEISSEIFNPVGQCSSAVSSTSDTLWHEINLQGSPEELPITPLGEQPDYTSDKVNVSWGFHPNDDDIGYYDVKIIGEVFFANCLLAQDAVDVHIVVTKWGLTIDEYNAFTVFGIVVGFVAAVLGIALTIKKLIC